VNTESEATRGSGGDVDDGNPEHAARVHRLEKDLLSVGRPRGIGSGRDSYLSATVERHHDDLRPIHAIWIHAFLEHDLALVWRDRRLLSPESSRQLAARAALSVGGNDVAAAASLSLV